MKGFLLLKMGRSKLWSIKPIFLNKLKNLFLKESEYYDARSKKNNN